MHILLVTRVRYLCMLEGSFLLKMLTDVLKLSNIRNCRKGRIYFEKSEKDFYGGLESIGQNYESKTNSEFKKKIKNSKIRLNFALI